MVDKITVDTKVISNLIDNGSTLEEIVQMMEEEKAAIREAEKNGTEMEQPAQLYVVKSE